MRIFLAGLALLAASLFAFSSLAPAFQYDEAWWGLWLHRMATEPGFHPFFGMSSYTSTLPHLLTVGALQLFGPHVWVLRLVPKLEVLAGVSLLSAALAECGELEAAALLPGLIAFFPALVMNSRWAVELTTFAVLCTGLVALGLARRARRGPGRTASVLIYAGSVLALLSHVFLVAPLFALWYWLFTQDRLRLPRDRRLVAGIAASMGVILTAIHLHDPSRPVWLALFAVIFGIAGVSFLRIPARWRGRALLVPAVLGTPLLVPLVVHLEGNWQARQYTGALANPWLLGAILVPLSILVLGPVRAGWKKRGEIFRQAAFVPLCLLGTYAIVGRVGARFLEVPFLAVAVALAVACSRVSRPRRALFLALWAVAGSAVLAQNYLVPSIRGEQVSSVFRLWRIMKDSSEDFLSKEKVIQKYAADGCRNQDLPPEAKGIELEFLALGDWPPVRGGGCRRP